MDNKKKITIAAVVILLLIIVILLFCLMNKKCTVTFDSNGGTEVASQTIKKGQTAKEPEEPTYEGHSFLGWYTDENDTIKFDFNTKIKKNMTLIAKWEENIDDENVEISEVSIYASKSEIALNEAIVLTLKILPENAKKDGLEIIWTSSDESIAKVDEDGKVTGLKAGKATITVKVGEHTATFEITVSEEAKGDTETETTPTSTPTNEPTNTPTSNPTSTPTKNPTKNPTKTPTSAPTKAPTSNPTSAPTQRPTSAPTNAPTQAPTSAPTQAPTQAPTPEPTKVVTYSYKWERIEGSVAGQYRLYVVNSDNQKVSGTATVTTTKGKSSTVSIPASGVVYVKDAIASVSNVKGN